MTWSPPLGRHGLQRHVREALHQTREDYWMVISWVVGEGHPHHHQHDHLKAASQTQSDVNKCIVRRDIIITNKANYLVVKAQLNAQWFWNFLSPLGALDISEICHVYKNTQSRSNPLSRYFSLSYEPLIHRWY